MGFLNKKTPWEKEWKDLLKKEDIFKRKRSMGPTSLLINKLDRFVPKKLTETLDKGFFKAFEVIFDKGTGVIEKTYNKRKTEADFKLNTYEASLRKNRKTARKFTKQATGSKFFNLSLATIEGVGLGIVGLGIPDIPLFIGLTLKSVYQVALSYGYNYESEEEKIFILKLIQVAMMDEEEFLAGDNDVNLSIEIINQWGDEIQGWNINKEEQMRATSKALSKEMLYTKFLQGYMIVGIFGGIFDPIYVNRISDYAVLKYRRRFLLNKISSTEGK